DFGNHGSVAVIPRVQDEREATAGAPAERVAKFGRGTRIPVRFLCDGVDDIDEARIRNVAQTVLDRVRRQAGSDFIHERLMGECVLEAMRRAQPGGPQRTSHDPVQHALARNGAAAEVHIVHSTGDVRRDGVVAVAVSRRIAWRRGRGDHRGGGKTSEVARYCVAERGSYSALTALQFDVFVVPRNDRAAGVKTNLFIADHGVAVAFTGYHFIASTV